MFNDQLDVESPNHLRNDLMVKTWIDTYQKDKWNQHPNCRLCGWPHSPVTMCGMGSTFGVVTLGGHRFWVDTSNVAWLRGFMDSLSSLGFHQRNERFFKRVDNNVVVSYIEDYNNHPQLKQWVIPVNEFASVVRAVSKDGETGERYREELAFLGGALAETPQPALEDRETKR